MRPCLAGAIAAFSVLSSAIGAQDSPTPGTSRLALPITLGADGPRDLRGSGPDYEVVFEPAAMEFLPALGVTLDAPHGLRLEFLSARRSAVEHRFGAAPVRVTEPERVRYRRGPFDEIYDLREDGIAQSFEFRALPPGGGDLVVRFRVTTPLVAARDGDGLLFSTPEAGGVHVGGVTGIDAHGVRVAGSIEYANGLLALTLPGEFVEDAALPLILDPLIGSTTQVPNGLFDQQDTDITFDRTNDMYLVVFTREVAGVQQIRGQRIDTSGAMIGSTLFIESTSTDKYEPRAGNVHLREGFVVCWQENGDIRARGVLADGTIGPNSVAVTSGGDFDFAPDVGGEGATSSDDAIVVWQSSTLTTDDVHSATLALTELGQVLVGIPRDLSFGFQRNRAPSISQTGGASGRWLVTWQRVFPTHSDIVAVILDRSLNILDNFGITGDLVTDDNPACDGDGTNWVVAWQQEELSPGKHDILCVPVRWNGAVATVGTPEPVADLIFEDEHDPVVGWAGDTAVIGWLDHVFLSNRDNAYYATATFDDCLVCETQGEVDVTLRSSAYLAIATQRHGAQIGSDDHAMFVWTSQDTSTSDGETLVQRVRGLDGDVTDLGGGCGAGGTASGDCAIIGNATFGHRLTGAATTATCALLLSLDQLEEACGPCQLMVDPFVGWTLPSFTGSTGNAIVTMPMPTDPALAGFRFYDQWLVASPSPQCTAIGLDFSNGISVRIQ